MTLCLTEAGFVPGSHVGNPTHELAVHEALLTAAAALLPRIHHSRVAVHEFAIRGARPDVVVADVDLERLSDRADAGLEGLTATADIAVLSALRTGRELGEHEVLERASRYVSGSKARAALRRLRALEFIVDGTIGLRCSKAASPGVRRAVGIEAKMRDWRRAADQARRWRLMFDQAFLAFPASYACQLPQGLAGIGLYGVAAVSGSAVRVISRPPVRRSDAFNASLLEEALYARLLDEAKLASEGDSARPIELVA
jgi:hypothetical protein